MSRIVASFYGAVFACSIWVAGSMLAVSLGGPYIVVGHPVANGRMELTIYQNDKALKKREVKFTSESKLQQIAAGIITYEFLPRVGINTTAKAFVTRAGWVSGNYVMLVGYVGRLGGVYR